LRAMPRDPRDGRATHARASPCSHARPFASLFRPRWVGGPMRWRRFLRTPTLPRSLSVERDRAAGGHRADTTATRLTASCAHPGGPGLRTPAASRVVIAAGAHAIWRRVWPPVGSDLPRARQRRGGFPLGGSRPRPMWYQSAREFPRWRDTADHPDLCVTYQAGSAAGALPGCCGAVLVPASSWMSRWLWRRVALVMATPRWHAAAGPDRDYQPGRRRVIWPAARARNPWDYKPPATVPTCRVPTPTEF